MTTLSLPNFVESEPCHSGKYCNACRDMGKHGDRFRTALAQGFILPRAPAMNQIFACPHGVPLDAKGWGDKVRRITNFVGIDHCGGCEKDQEALNEQGLKAAPGVLVRATVRAVKKLVGST